MSEVPAVYEKAGVVNGSTGEILPDKPFENEFNVSSMLSTAGKIELTDAQKDILFHPVDPDDVEIRPDGIIYLPWMEYASRLSKAFGLKWALIPQGMPKFKNNYIFWGFWLVIDGHLSGYSIGEQKYFSTSSSGETFMTYGDAVEGAKSNALMRLCKGLGISIELWKPKFVRTWKEKYAIASRDGGKVKWRRKDKVVDEAPPTPEPHTASMNQDQFLAVISEKKQAKNGQATVMRQLMRLGYKTPEDVPPDQYQVVIAAIDKDFTGK